MRSSDGFAVWLPNQPPRKSNHRRIVRGKGGKPRLIKSQAALDWVDDVDKTTTGDKRRQVGSPKIAIRLTFVFFYRTNNADMSVELPMDAMQHARVLSDDRYVWVVEAYKLFCREEQGVWVFIEEIDVDYPFRRARELAEKYRSAPLMRMLGKAKRWKR